MISFKTWQLSIQTVTLLVYYFPASWLFERVKLACMEPFEIELVYLKTPYTCCGWFYNLLCHNLSFFLRITRCEKTLMAMASSLFHYLCKLNKSVVNCWTFCCKPYTCFLFFDFSLQGGLSSHTLFWRTVNKHQGICCD